MALKYLFNVETPEEALFKGFLLKRLSVWIRLTRNNTDASFKHTEMKL